MGASTKIQEIIGITIQREGMQYIYIYIYMGRKKICKLMFLSFPPLYFFVILGEILEAAFQFFSDFHYHPLSISPSSWSRPRAARPKTTAQDKSVLNCWVSLFINIFFPNTM